MVQSRVSSEEVLLVFFLIISGYMLLGSYDIGNPEAAMFPRYTAGATFVFAAILLFKDVLPIPGPLRPYVEDTGGLYSDQQEEFASERTDEDQAEQDEREIFESNNVYFSMVMVGLYVLVSYLISILYATPLFVIAYMLWFRVPWYIIAFTAVLMTAIVYAFVVYLFIPADDGILLRTYGLFAGTVESALREGSPIS